MNLHSSYPFWMIKEGIIHAFPKLHDNATAEVVVIGGGITGALIADHLLQAGLEVLLVEKRHIAHGSTSASTAMLQYELDEPLFRLAKETGQKNAETVYRLCSDAIDEVGAIAGRYPDKADFEKCSSLYFASFEHHVADIIRPEYAARKKAGFDVELLRPEEIKTEFGFDAPAAILSGQAAQVNPYKLCNYLLRDVENRGGRVYDSTEIATLEEAAKGILLRTTTGYEIKARHVIVACGYESHLYLPKDVAHFNSTYALASMPFKELPWKKKALIWETRTPYMYLRTTADQRIIIGGRDESRMNAETRDQLLPLKKLQLENDFKSLFPDVSLETDFAWAGTFGQTADSLPFIGSYDKPDVYYAMGYGGNGITFSVIAARMLTDAIQGKKNPHAALFSFKRMEKSEKSDAW